MCRKIEIVVAVMKLGYDVVFVDADMVLLRDPLPAMVWNNVDFAVSDNEICHGEFRDPFGMGFEANTGLYFMRSNAKTITLWQAVVSKFEHAE